MRPFFIALLLLAPLVSGGVTAQQAPAVSQISDATIASLARDLRWRNIGPGNMSGRIAAVEALSTDYRHVLAASASGGVFRSTNAGVTWDPIFDNSGGAGSIGAVAMFEPNPDIIWVGTGEAANRNSSGKVLGSMPQGLILGRYVREQAPNTDYRQAMVSGALPLHRTAAWGRP